MTLRYLVLMGCSMSIPEAEWGRSLIRSWWAGKGTLPDARLLLGDYSRAWEGWVRRPYSDLGVWKGDHTWCSWAAWVIIPEPGGLVSTSYHWCLWTAWVTIYSRAGGQVR